MNNPADRMNDAECVPPPYLPAIYVTAVKQKKSNRNIEGRQL